MKKIKIFLASSITELKIDRIEVGDFIRQLNEIYFDRGVRFSLVKCDDYDNAIAAEGKQSQFDKEILDSELCFFLFFKRVGDYTRHEFEVALDGFKSSEKPKIVTYFKYITSPQEMEGEVQQFMKMLDEEIKHYYNVYQNIDTLKLGILMQIKLMGLDVEEPKVENGRVTFGGLTVADTQNLPIFTGNASLTELKNSLEALTRQYYELQQKARSEPENDALYSAYFRVANEKAAAEQAVRNAERAVLEASKRMHETTGRGSLSPRQIAAYHAFELGNYKDALEILDPDEIIAELDHNEQMAEGYRERIQINVNELLQRIEVMKADGIDKDEAEEIEKIYETVLERIEKHKLEKAPLYDYACFLSDQNNHEKAIEVAKQLEYEYANPKAPASDRQKAHLWNLLGTLYSNTQRYGEAEDTYKKAIEVCERLSEQDPAAFEPYSAMCYGNLGLLYSDTQRYTEAEELYKKAIGIRERLTQQNPAAHEPNLAISYNALGILYSDTQRYAEAEDTYKKAIEIQERLAQQNPAAFEPELAMSYNNLGLLYRYTQRYAESENAHKKAVAIDERLAQQNPAAFEPDLSGSYNNLGNLYSSTQHYMEAEEKFKKAIEIRERLSKQNPAAFEPNLAAGYMNLGNLYVKTYRHERVEELYGKAIAIYERLAQQNPAAFEPTLAGSYLNLGIFYELTKRYEEALERYGRAFELAKKYPQNSACIQVLRFVANRGFND